ncbi:DUF4280 domain-containing protein [Desulfovibrio sp. OttesenSCG-928-G15]|nr:DUF4280 domain-containing protein [Desulfovibrio sp. OttesenSCG-928-G15]
MNGNDCITEGCICRCSFGSCATALRVSPRKTPERRNTPCVNDHIPMVNIQPFGMCNSPQNPQVRAAGQNRPMPCLPKPLACWSSGDANTLLDGTPALTARSTLQCAYGGVISVENAAK